MFLENSDRFKAEMFSSNINRNSITVLNKNYELPSDYNQNCTTTTAKTTSVVHRHSKEAKQLSG